MSENDIIKKIEERYRKGEISRETYESIMEEYRKEREEEKKEDVEEERLGGGVSIAGSGSVDNVKGEYLKISGSGKVEGDVDVKEVKIAGSAKIEGNVRAERVKCAGACRIEGNLRAKEVKIAGSMHVEGDAEADTIEFSGGMKIEGNVASKVLKSAGGTKCEGKIIAREKLDMGGSISALSIDTPIFRGKGSIKVDSSVKCETFRLEMDGNSSAGRIEADKIEIISGNSKGIISRIFGRKGSLKAKKIKGKSISVENTIADMVEGENVNIGPGCRIGVLRASRARVHESSRVMKRA